MNTAMNAVETVTRHYTSPGLLGRIEAGLSQIGKSPQSVSLDDLAPVDEFHVRGPAATTELIEWLDPTPGARVLDLGSGLGGPARRLAQSRDCTVTGVDMSADYCEVGTAINGWAGLGNKVALTQGDATRLDRFADASFDAAWTIHVGMNIADKAGLYREAGRVLKPGARFVLYDVLTADGAPEIDYPMPWADDASASFLVTLEQLTAHLQEAGFAVEQVRDQSAEAGIFFDQTIARASQADGPPPLGLHLVLGPKFANILPNIRKNLGRGSLRVVGLSAIKSTS